MDSIGFINAFPASFVQWPGIHCIQVNDVNLHGKINCGRCAQPLWKRYVRKIRTHTIYCDFRCYDASRASRTDAER